MLTAGILKFRVVEIFKNLQLPLVFTKCEVPIILQFSTMTQTELCEDYSVLKLNLKGHKKPVTGLCFDPDGKQFASSSEDHTIMIWNSAQNIRSYSFLGHSDIVTAVEYSPNGKLVASCSQDQTVRIWVPTVKGVSTDFRAHTSAIRTLAFSPDSNKVRVSTIGDSF
jgi:WD40 repeat protein